MTGGMTERQGRKKGGTANAQAEPDRARGGRAKSVSEILPDIGRAAFRRFGFRLLILGEGRARHRQGKGGSACKQGESICAGSAGDGRTHGSSSPKNPPTPAPYRHALFGALSPVVVRSRLISQCCVGNKRPPRAFQRQFGIMLRQSHTGISPDTTFGAPRACPRRILALGGARCCIAAHGRIFGACRNVRGCR